MSSTSPTKQPKVDALSEWESVNIALPDNRSYPIVFASISDLGRALNAAGLAKSSSRRAALVSNSVVGKLKHKDEALQALKEAGWDVAYLEIEDG